jgi:hypothetical protein
MRSKAGGRVFTGQLGVFSPGLKTGQGKMKRSRGFENPLPRTEVWGWHSFPRHSHLRFIAAVCAIP